jgi:hypothetical protein
MADAGIPLHTTEDRRAWVDHHDPAIPTP